MTASIADAGRRIVVGIHIVVMHPIVDAQRMDAHGFRF
jgi:hypothetical protein